MILYIPGEEADLPGVEAGGSYWRTKFQPNIDAQDRLHFFLDGLVSSSLRDFWTSLDNYELVPVLRKL